MLFDYALRDSLLELWLYIWRQIIVALKVEKKKNSKVE